MPKILKKSANLTTYQNFWRSDGTEPDPMRDRHVF